MRLVDARRLWTLPDVVRSYSSLPPSNDEERRLSNAGVTSVARSGQVRSDVFSCLERRVVWSSGISLPFSSQYIFWIFGEAPSIASARRAWFADLVVPAASMRAAREVPTRRALLRPELVFLFCLCGRLSIRFLWARHGVAFAPSFTRYAKLRRRG